MRIKGGLAKGLVAALVLTFLPLVAFSAQKITPGSTCKVLNQKVVYLTKTYSCVKSGKKLVWNKGVVIIKPSPKATPVAIGGTPSPTATPTPSPTPTVKAISNVPGIGPTGRFQYRYIDGVMQRKNIDGIWRSDDSRPSSDFDLIRKSAFDSTWSISNSTPN